jgi:hypothetical protein
MSVVVSLLALHFGLMTAQQISLDRGPTAYLPAAIAASAFTFMFILFSWCSFLLLTRSVRAIRVTQNGFVLVREAAEVVVSSITLVRRIAGPGEGLSAQERFVVFRAREKLWICSEQVFLEADGATGSIGL